jgi:hypothetical protein
MVFRFRTPRNLFLDTPLPRSPPYTLNNKKKKKKKKVPHAAGAHRSGVDEILGYPEIASPSFSSTSKRRLLCGSGNSILKTRLVFLIKL